MNNINIPTTGDPITDVLCFIGFMVTIVLGFLAYEVLIDRPRKNRNKYDD